jgi:hypothetical protein
MKKILLTAFIAFGLYGAQAQTVCNPNGPNLPAVTQYIIPDSATNLLHACAGLPYEQIIYIKAPKDTTVVFSGFPVNATVDSIVVNLDSLGLPSYLSVVSAAAAKAPTATVPYNHIVLRGPGNDSLVCVKIFGTIPAGTAAGTLPLTIKLVASGKPPIGTTSIVLPSTVTSYKIVIDPAGSGVCNVAIKQLQNVNGVVITPNPTTGNAILTCNVTNAFDGNLSIVNAVGQVVYNRSLNLNIGQQKVMLPTEGLASGMYQVIVRQGTAQSTSKLIVQ